ncbi:MAG: ribosome maturation factor RimM [Prevotella sp.]|nr:ribosome maturation factor RimM [Prevotella sp.]MDE6151375.1 ribosome maturation factor RimM [Prevotella sp.]
MIKDSDVYRIGRVGKPHGVKGEVQVQVDDDVFDRVGADYLVLRVDGILVPFFMEEYRFKSDEIALVTFCDMDSSEKVRKLTGCEVFFPRSLADEVEHDLTYAELVGYSLVDANTGRRVGTIEFVDDATENILFEMDNGSLIPAPEELIVDVDTENRTVTVAVPEGLLDMDE